MEISLELIDAIGRHSERPVSPALQALIDDIRERHGQAVQGVLFYGSCLRSGDDFDGLVDLYLLVDSYRSAYQNRWQALLNTLLPPNVYYLERKFKGRTVRTKYAVVSLADFQKGTSMRWFHSYLWGRFSQPTALLYARNDAVRELVLKCLAQSVLTFVKRVLPPVRSDFTAQEMWRRGLILSYGAELRSEKPEKRARLYDAAPQYYEEITQLALKAVDEPIESDSRSGLQHYRRPDAGWKRVANRWAWKLRSWQGKLLSLMRLIKAALTFEGGVDYILWKIQRHSGVTVECEPRLKQRPFLAMWVLSWRLYRKGGFR